MELNGSDQDSEPGTGCDLEPSAKRQKHASSTAPPEADDGTKPACDDDTTSSVMPYTKEQNILVVGDGDFSFSASLAACLIDTPGPSRIVATPYDDNVIVKNVMSYTEEAFNNSRYFS